MFANVNPRDVFAHLDDGIATQTIAVGTVSGSAIPLSGPGQLRRYWFILQLTSGTNSSGAASMYLMTATASNAAFTSLSQTLVSLSVSSLATKQFLELNTRNEAFADLGTTARWVKPVVAISGAALPAALLVLGYLAGSQPASLYDAATVGVSNTDFL